jgi:hypothetical protein
MVSINIIEPDYDSLIGHLLQDTQKENMAFSLCGLNVIKNKREFLVKKINVVQPRDLLIHSRCGLELKLDYYISILNECRKFGLSLFEWHSHPFCDIAHFSPIDNQNDYEHAQFFKSLLPNQYYGNVVVAQKDLSARVFNYKADTFEKVEQIKILYKMEVNNEN